MITTFGPMPGAYTGAYPTRQQAITALQNAQEISVPALIKDTFTLNSKKYTLDRSVGPGILGTSQWKLASGPAAIKQLKQDYGDTVKATLYQKTCLILHIPTGLDLIGNGKSASYIALVDTASGRPFAYYTVGNPDAYPSVYWNR